MELEQEAGISHGFIHAILCNDLKIGHFSVVTHRATHHLLCSSSSQEKHSCCHPTAVLSKSLCEWLLAVPYCESGPQEDAFPNHGWHQIEWEGRTPDDSKWSLPPVLPTNAGSMEHVCVCVCARFLLWMVVIMSYHYCTIPHFQELRDCPSYGILATAHQQSMCAECMNFWTVGDDNCKISLFHFAVLRTILTLALLWILYISVSSLILWQILWCWH
jgi:hypothetical protein